MRVRATICMITLAAAAASGCRPTEENRQAPSGNEVARAPAKPPPQKSQGDESIIRPDVLAETEKPQEPKLEPAKVTLDFSEAHDEIPPGAKSALDDLLHQPIMAEGGCIVIRGHTDSRGSDEQNLRVSKKRADLVADYIIDHGIDKSRISVIGLGERRPVAPNANLDGSDNPEGRAKNRRVTVEVQLANSQRAGDGEATARSICGTQRADGDEQGHEP